MDGKFQQHRCFAASTEAARPSVRRSTDRNWQALKRAQTTEAMADLIHKNLPDVFRFPVIRVHVHGDYFSQSYFLAWMEVARRNPERLFYSYTKSLSFWVTARGMVPPNFVLTASRGGKFDHLIDMHNLREAVVVFHPEEAAALGLEIDHDDSHAMNPKVRKFALLLHGMQAKGSKASAARQRLLREGVPHQYSKKRGVPVLR